MAESPERTLHPPLPPTELACLVGIGGARPGVALYAGSKITWALDWEAGDSPYALAVAADGSTWAAGTKGGFLVFGTSGASSSRPDPADDHVTERRMVGAPVLSVAHVGGSNWITTDSRGRCLCWSAQEAPTRLPNPGSPVCALARHQDGRLYGLSITGQLHHWDVRDGCLLESVAVCPPARPYAMVQLTYWDAAESWVWPGRGGHISLYHEPSGSHGVLDLHSGGSLAYVIAENVLYSIGRRDGWLRCVLAGEARPSHEYRLLIESVGVGLAGWEPLRLMVISPQGTCAFFAISESGVERVQELECRDARRVVSPAWTQWAEAECDRRSARAADLADRITALSSNGADQNAIEALHRELDSIGYPHVSLGLRAEDAQRRADLVDELAAYHQLAKLIPAHAPQSRPAIQRYLELLAATWQLEAVAELTNGRADRVDFPARVAELQERIAAMCERPCILQPEISPAVILGAAHAIGRMSRHRFVLRLLEPFHFENRSATPQILLDEYEHVRSASENREFPAAQLSDVCWLTDRRIDDTTLLWISANGRLTGLQFAVKHSASAGTQTFQPVVLLDAAAVSATTCLGDQLSRFRGDGAQRWLARLHEITKRLLREMLTECVERR